MNWNYATRFAIASVVVLSGCGDRSGDKRESNRASLPPIFPKGPAGSTDWNADAGAVILIRSGNTDDSAAVVMPDVTDSTISFLNGVTPALNALRVDLFGRSGKIESGVPLTVVSGVDTTEGCFTWPAARLPQARSGWAVAFATGRVVAVALDSIESMSGVDSAALAAALTQSAATLPATSDPVFRGLPFRVRSAFTFHFDSTDAVVADIVRSVNEEANPRLEHLLLVGEKPMGTAEKYSVAYYHRTAGAEESTQVTEVLAVILLGRNKHPAAVLNVEYGDGGRFGLLERTQQGEWRTTWRSAYTGC
jgi:hypothetical protein